MKTSSSEKKEWVLTKETFDCLLAWLNPDRDEAGKKYENIHAGLIAFFRKHACATPEDLADETINRVIRKLPELAKSYIGDPTRYFFGVAKFVRLEYFRRKPESELLQDYWITHPESLESANIVNDEPIPSEQEFIAFALIDNRIKLVSLTPDGSYRFLDSAENLHSLIYVRTAETLTFQLVVEELEAMVNDTKAKEREFQDFFERYPDFIMNDDYKKAHPQIVLTRDDGKILRPDFVLEPIDQNSLCDLLELKLPSTRIFVLQESRMRFSSDVMEACAQLRTYSEFFDEERNRLKIRTRYGLLAYKPKMFVVIGRRGNVSPIDLRRIETDVPNLILRSYDDVILRAKAKLQAMKVGRVRI